MRRITGVGLGVALAVALLLPVTSGAEKPEGKGKAGGKSLEHRSEKAAERSNSQWQQDSTRGQERAEQVREQRKSSGDEAAKPEEPPKQAKKAKKAKKAKHQAKEQGKQPRGEPTSFWERWFGGRSQDAPSDEASE